MVVKDRVGIAISSGDGVRPELFHKEDLIRELRRDAVSHRTSLLDPVSQVAHKVEEEIPIGNTDH